MKKLEPISLDVARQLIDFRGGTGPGQGIPPIMAEAQLDGAVALHNILAREGFAYLADEVGMGKTFVALGAVSLMRYFNPGLRVAYISPRENIQEKWVKELRNFSRTNWRARDHLVRTLDDLPACEFVSCGNLIEWARMTVRQPHRDVFLRLTSFSFPLAGQIERWRAKREEVAELAPMVDTRELDLKGREKSKFKEAYARAINTLLPHYDLVIVDEAHNLKGGRSSHSARNRLIEMVFGTAEDQPTKHYGKRFDRVLFLSATPIENDFVQLWNQLDLFGFRDARWDRLKDPDAPQNEKRELARSFLVRRLTGLSIGGELHTKNMYRREWRAGGCTQHDYALDIPGARQRLIVALVQKKVAEVIGDPRFGKSFQMGMLASFESFAQTAIRKPTEDEEQSSNFDSSDQTDEKTEREGVDTPAVNRVADSYRRTFGASMPHPKMDAVVDSLAKLFDTGDKALVFVRRVRSVPELREKLCDRYDAWFRPALEQQLDPRLRDELADAWVGYVDERSRKRGRAFELEHARISDEDADEDEPRTSASTTLSEDQGGHETFFSWFFRGEGPKGFLSGAALRKNRFQSTGSVYSTFFEDNHVAELIGWGQHGMVAHLAAELGSTPEGLTLELRDLAEGACRHRTTRQARERMIVFEAYQAAALHLLSKRAKSELTQARARVALRERFPWAAKLKSATAPRGFPEAEDFLGMKTFFTELRFHPELRDSLWPDVGQGNDRQRFRAREQRRELLASVAGLGHAFVELWALAVNQLGSLREGRRESSGDDVQELIGRFLELLESQRAVRQQAAAPLDAFHELSSVGQNHELILAVNFPDVVEKPLEQLPRLLAATLGRQTPVAGMYGGVSKKAVAQFRMPGYPLALIATDVLQEGEDLHTFCSKVFHYGISWTPSAMEQRTGRVDRIGSKAHRTLDNLPAKPNGAALLQVHYPYLPDTVEVLQVERVFERMNHFLRTIHHTGADSDGDSRIDTNAEFARPRKDIQQITTPLKSAFEVVQSDLQGSSVDVSVPDRALKQKLRHLDFLITHIEDYVCIDWEPHDEAKASRVGSVFIRGDRLLSSDEAAATGDARKQPIQLFLRTSATGELLLHAASPVGLLSSEEHSALSLLELQAKLRGTKLCRVPTKHAGSYAITAEADLLFAPGSTHVEELVDMLQRVAVGADMVEREYLPDGDGVHEELFEQPRGEVGDGAD